MKILKYTTLLALAILFFSCSSDENAADKTIRIFDLAGNALLQKECTVDKETLELSNLQRGIYIITVGNDKFKFVKL